MATKITRKPVPVKPRTAQPVATRVIGRGVYQPAPTVAPGTGAQAPQATAPPPDPIFLAQQAAAQRSLAIGGAWDTYSRGRIENSYGLGADTSNPYSKAALMREDYLSGQRGTESNYANAGQINSGAYQSAKNYNARQYSIGDDRLRREYQDQKDAITKGATDRYSQLGADLSAEDLTALIRSIGR